MVRRGAAAAADHVHQAGRGELADQLRHCLRALVIEPELVRQAGIGIGADQRIGDTRQIVDMGAHLLGAERAVQPDGEGLRMPQRVPERLRRLAGKGAAGKVGDGAGDHHRHADAARLEQPLDGEHRRLGVQRVEDGLDQQEIRPAVQQRAGLLAIGGGEFVERGGAEAGIIDVRRDRGGAVGRPDGAGDEAAAAILRLGQLRRLLGELGTLEIDLVDNALHAVIGHGDGGAGEGVGLDDVGAGEEIGEMDVPHRVRSADVQEVVIAAHIAVPRLEPLAAIAGLIQLELLDHRAHRPVEHQYALGGGSLEGFEGVVCYRLGHD